MNRRWIIPFLLCAIVITGVWGIAQYRQKNVYQIYMQNQYQRMFYELLDHVENIQVDFSKVLVSGSTEQNNKLFSDISRQSFSAQEKLNQLPVTHSALNKTSKFLTQTADYSSSMVKKNEPLNSEHLENVTDLYNNAVKLTGELRTLFDKMADGSVNIGEVQKGVRLGIVKAPTKTLDEEFQKVHEKMTEYPTLIYDGPFSEHLIEQKPRELTGSQITFDQAKKIAADFIGADKIKDIRRGSDSTGFIKTYGLEVIPKENAVNPIYMSITKTGGHIAWMLDNRHVGSKKLSLEEINQKAVEFMNKKGFKDMVPTYSMINNDTGVVNFAYTQDKVIIYPDLIKIKVALDNGEIVGWEAQKYLMSHRARKIKQPLLTEDEASKYISSSIKTKEGRLALIPTDNGNEVLTYEFKGDYRGDEFLIYINANNGNEEKILKLIKSKSGTLTI
ncbi:MAG TPA: germination protein YpeB [Thermoanaerobacterales bacterium]|nr:germination protein YpeB [Thermoanaerobacterales bacterium]